MQTAWWGRGRKVSKRSSQSPMLQIPRCPLVSLAGYKADHMQESILCIIVSPPLHVSFHLMSLYLSFQPSFICRSCVSLLPGSRFSGLRESAIFKQLNDGSRAIRMECLGGKERRLVVNDVYLTYFRRPEEFMKDAWARRCLIGFLLAA